MSKTTKSETENKPPAWAEPLFKQSASEAQRLYKSKQGGNVFQGSTVADMSDTTTNALSRIGEGGYAGKYLEDTASGKYLTGEGNPFYRQRLEKEIGDSNALIQSQFSGMGRYGSGANQSTIADNTSNMLMAGLENDWNRERTNQLAAVGMLDDQLGQQVQAGSMLDQHKQAQLADEVARFYANDNKGWTRLGMLQGAAAGAAGNYGTQQQMSRQPINPWGALGGLFSKSDIRLKENIAAVGVANGITIYEWNYRGQPDRWRGVMAQELPLGSPALVMEDDGYLAVDYARLGMEMTRGH